MGLQFMLALLSSAVRSASFVTAPGSFRCKYKGGCLCTKDQELATVTLHYYSHSSNQEIRTR